METPFQAMTARLHQVLDQEQISYADMQGLIAAAQQLTPNDLNLLVLRVDALARLLSVLQQQRTGETSHASAPLNRQEASNANDA